MMKIFNRLLPSLILCSITLFANANDVGISLVSGSIEPLRNQLSFLFTFTWDDTSIDDMPEQSYFYSNADKKNASEQEKEWYSGKTIVSADFYRDSGINGDYLHLKMQVPQFIPNQTRLLIIYRSLLPKSSIWD